MHNEDGQELTLQITEILKLMFLLCKHLSLYSEDNKVVVQTTERLLSNIEQVHSSGIDILVTVSKHGFLVQGEFINQKNQLFSSFARRMFQHGISSFTLLPGLAAPSLYAFLRLLLRKPAETWDEGGIGASIANRKIVGIQLTEMTESDFRLLDAEEDPESVAEPEPSEDLWRKFAKSIFSSLTGEELEDLSQETSPAALADRISEMLTGRPPEEQAALTLELTRFITTLQRERMKTARTAALLNLADFINHLTADLRQKVLNSINKQHLAEEHAEEFFNGLSDESIIDAFREATKEEGYTPPVVMSLISKLAGQRKLLPEEELAAYANAREDMARKAKELFRPDEFKKYVPDRYQKALMQVLSSQQPPKGLSDKLEELKRSLEDFQQEQQMARLSLFILENDPDEEFLNGLRDRLIRSMQYHLDASDYIRLVALCKTSFSDKSSEHVRSLIEQIPETFIKQVISDAPRLGKDVQPQIADVISLIGAPFVRPLLEATATEDDRSVRFFYLNNLKKLGGQVADQAVRFLADERWFVQRNMLILLGELGAKDKLSKIKPLLNHNHQKVRQEALKTCLLLHDNDSIEKLIKTLASDNRQEVLHAITMSQLVDNPKLSKAMLTMLQEQELFKFDYDIKKALAHALAEHRNSKAINVFTRILNSRRLFNSGPYNKFKVEVIKALGKYPAEKVSGLLNQQVKNGSESVASQARQVLKKMTQEESR